ncbi:MAG: cupin domain-containing protein [Anaerolineae bacterium]|nr:cupin domain-containing protein [Anaerolineae bacterium]
MSSVIRQADAPRTPGPSGGTRYLAHTDGLMVVVWEFEGPAEAPDPAHSHPHEQVTYVAEGELLFFIEEEPHHLKPGDMIAVPGGVSHTIQVLTSHVRLVDAFTPVRAEFL